MSSSHCTYDCCNLRKPRYIVCGMNCIPLWESRSRCKGKQNIRWKDGVQEDGLYGGMWKRFGLTTVSSGDSQAISMNAGSRKF